MRRSPGRRAAPVRAPARSRCALSGPCSAMPLEDGQSARAAGAMVRASAEAVARASAEAVARASYGKLVAFLAARTRDVAGAEDALSEAFAAALVDWPVSGIPASPEAWLMAVARRKLIDAGRRRRSHEGAAGHLQLMREEVEAAAASETQIPDDRL